ncbi:hypothetical protein [Chitinophaga filiformis]|uniref:Uncharacterized protein n=1 Tax=Chitinophaga filiformis TaxID=104663 RepID=A0A1G7N935_CHIFI|nr:hypothetical protein [Chitinophaga filiformis]SDF70568.1 hypothetical protein SAMN04488121_102713 [Chitinophaga filiformis]
MSIEDVDRYIVDKVFPKLTKQVLKNTALISILPHDMVENDANDKASKKLPLEYSRAVSPKPIMINGVKLKE